MELPDSVAHPSAHLPLGSQTTSNVQISQGNFFSILGSKPTFKFSNIPIFQTETSKKFQRSDPSAYYKIKSNFIISLFSDDTFILPIRMTKHTHTVSVLRTHLETEITFIDKRSNQPTSLPLIIHKSLIYR